ncbi:MAG: alpha/beta hydrolase-fold protein [Chloroflexota bacterium]
MPNWESFDAFLREAEQTPVDQRQELVDALLRERLDWPWVQGKRATFIYVSMGAQHVALNLDTIERDPPFAPMAHLDGTTLWHVTGEFEEDDLLDYLLAIDDPLTPLATERDMVGRIARHWRVDPLNTTRMNTAQMNVSVLRMGKARPFPDWSKFNQVKRGKITEHSIDSMQLGFTGRKLWVYTPPDYETSGQGMMYPLLIFQDGQWGVGPLQIPHIADALIKHGHMQPVIIAMTQSGDQKDRIKNFVSNDRHYTHILTELLPFLQTQYRIDSADLGVGGVAVGGQRVAALKNPAVFNHLILISPPLGKGIAQEQLRTYAGRFKDARVLPGRIFQSVGRYETRSRFYLPAQVLNRILSQRPDVAYQYIEIGSGHGLVGFRSVLPEALSWIFPGENTT